MGFGGFRALGFGFRAHSGPTRKDFMASMT